MNNSTQDTLSSLKFNDQGLIPCITVSAKDNAVLMMAWMNEEALNKTIESREMHYWSRSRNEIWHKGATSGHVQHVVSLKADCDSDCLLALVDVQSDEEIACHTGKRSCFFNTLL